MIPPAFVQDAMRPYVPNACCCWTAVEAATQHDARCVRMFEAWRRHIGRAEAILTRQADVARLAGYMARLHGLTPAGSRGPAIGLALLSEGAAVVIRANKRWYGRANPSGVYVVDSARVVEQHEVAPWIQS
jgi:hypothetical protein